MGNLRRGMSKEKLALRLEKTIATLSRPIPNVGIRKALTDEEFLFFLEEKEKLLKDFPDVNFSSDERDINFIVLEEIYQLRLLRLEKLDLNWSLADAYDESCKRIQDLKRSLGIRRIDRIVMGKNKSRPSISIVSISEI